MRELVLREPLQTLWRDSDPFAEVASLSGEVVRHKEGRETLRCVIDGEVFYRKRHSGVGWGEIVKNWLQLRQPVVDASNEWRAIERLHQLGIRTLHAVGYGRRGDNPATRESFLVTRELKNALSTAVFTQSWPDDPPPYPLRVAMTKKIAGIARQLHRHGINHRDLYLCHFLLDIHRGVDQLSPSDVDFFLVDLHRAQMRKKVPQRWLVKDIGSIYFSALDIGLTKKDVLRFLRDYYDLPLRQILSNKKGVLKKIQRRAEKLYRRDFNREAIFPL